MTGPRVSIIIPCYNEESRLPRVLAPAIRELNAILGSTYELILVDDGSQDRTRNLLEQVRVDYPSVAARIVAYAPNRGKGYAVKTGVLQARGERVLVMDADFSIALDEIGAFLAALDDHDLVIGAKRPAVEHHPAPPARRLLGRGFTWLANRLLGMTVTDITCGLKAFRGPAAARIFSRLATERWAYDAEALFLARRWGYRIRELPVRWQHIEGSKVRTLRDIGYSLYELALIRCRAGRD